MVFIPLSDDNPLRSISFQWVNVGLIVANVVAFLLQNTEGAQASILSFALIPSELFQAHLVGGPVASPQQAVHRVLLPMLYPAILASYAVVFADTVDDFVTASYLSGPASSQALSQFIYGSVRASPTPATNAAATVMLITTTAAIGLGYLAYKRVARGQEGHDVATFSQL